MSCPLVVSAPGKVILHGEHAVVYGKTALATSVDLRCFLALLPPREGCVELELPDIKLHKRWTCSEVMAVKTQEGADLEMLRELCGCGSAPSTESLALLAFLYLTVSICDGELRKNAGVHALVVSSLPASAGLGSSAAYSVCLAAGLLFISGQIERLPLPDSSSSSCSSSDSISRTLPALIAERLAAEGLSSDKPPCAARGAHAHAWSEAELRLVNKWGLEGERMIHGTPSGIDNSVSTYGGAISFKSGSVTPLKRMPNMKILLVNTKVSRSTKKMVANVRHKYEKFPGVMEPILEAIEALTVRAQQELEEGPDGTVLTTVQELFQVNHQLLNAIGVGHPSLDTVCAIAMEHGLAAKLTGAGGGGCAIVLIPNDFPEEKLENVRKCFLNNDCDCWMTVIGTNGVCLH